ncbi:bifunctional 2-polyprenyl-6-hydroxyphenol methylase/3-demethylubiquinol 3-O-methyltransferase UbiG [Palleronia sp.]|uniref:bifunctional 2-polyprenyl-6-hydroxyphenol methylase/3-demethylubiquinol 3-O-methyltransferase UbiG n=1 Tax=Palleronia sp. TaxID=1940284 RepID=UPI0035C865E7
MSSIDRSEVDKFSAMAAEWWDPNGKFRPLHQMNPIRLDYITRQIAAQFGRDLRDDRPFEGLSLLDIGCGGGLLAEPMTRLGAKVTGIDASERNIPVAQAHAEEQELTIVYRATTAEALAEEGTAYDVVLAMEVIEHVANPPEFMTTCGALLKPGGIVICSTLNRTAKSFALAIVGAEWVLRWLPRGTHDWNRFVTPEEMKRMMDSAGIACVDRTGMVFDPLSWKWSLSATDLSVNYVGTAVKD